MTDAVFKAALAALTAGLNQLAAQAGQKPPPDGGPPDPDTLARVALADRLAGGGKPAAVGPRPPLVSAFSRLNGYKQDRYVPVARLNPADQSGLFPQERPAPASRWPELYSEAAGQLSRRLQPGQSPAEQVEHRLAVLQDYGWCAPSAHADRTPDVSLFDHARTTAALASCLAAAGWTASDCAEADRRQKPVCLLVAGDLSGLQDFIYTLASSGAAKSLRARSFYVQLLSHALAVNLLERLQLPLSNLLYVGGGGFQLLASASQEADLRQAARELADRLLLVHQTALGLTVKWEPLTAADFAAFPAARDRLGQALNRAKRQPFSAASPEALWEALGEPLTQGGDPLRFCHVTGEDGPAVQQAEDGEWKSAFVLDLETLGQRLPNATHLAWAAAAPAPAARARSWAEALRAFGLEAQVLTGEAPEAGPLASGHYWRVWRLTALAPAGEADWLASLGRVVISYQPFAQLAARGAGGRPKTFDQLAKPRRGQFERWAVLRMDVDNLGQLFRSGFGEKASLAQTVGLSFALRLFFEGWLPQLAGPLNGQADLRDYLYLQYSGGDDLFVVGAWDAVVEFAARVRQSFGEYACGNPALTLSGGMTLVPENFPIHQAAQEAGEAEDAAKAYAANGRHKDAFTFLGQTLAWPDLAQARLEAYALADAIDAGRLNRSVLQTLLTLHAQRRRAQTASAKPAKPLYGPWTWMAAYQLSRVLQDKKIRDDADLTRRITQFQDQFLKPAADQVDSIGLIARWAQYLTRGK